MKIILNLKLAECGEEYDENDTCIFCEHDLDEGSVWITKDTEQIILICAKCASKFKVVK